MIKDTSEETKAQTLNQLLDPLALKILDVKAAGHLKLIPYDFLKSRTVSSRCSLAKVSLSINKTLCKARLTVYV